MVIISGLVAGSGETVFFGDYRAAQGTWSEGL